MKKKTRSRVQRKLIVGRIFNFLRPERLPITVHTSYLYVEFLIFLPYNYALLSLIIFFMFFVLFPRAGNRKRLSCRRMCRTGRPRRRRRRQPKTRRTNGLRESCAAAVAAAVEAGDDQPKRPRSRPPIADRPSAGRPCGNAGRGGAVAHGVAVGSGRTRADQLQPWPRPVPPRLVTVGRSGGGVANRAGAAVNGRRDSGRRPTRSACSASRRRRPTRSAASSNDVCAVAVAAASCPSSSGGCAAAARAAAAPGSGRTSRKANRPTPSGRPCSSVPVAAR